MTATLKVTVKLALAMMLAVLLAAVGCSCEDREGNVGVTDHEEVTDVTDVTESTAEKASEELEYTPIEGLDAYEVSGIGTYTAAELVIPSEHDGKPVTSIGERAFENCRQLTSVVIPNSVTEISENAFAGCESIARINVPSSVLRIGCSAFSACRGLTDITLPFVGETAEVNENSYFAYAFGCSGGYSQGPGYVPESLKNVTVTGGEIAENAFFFCMSLESVSLSGVTKLGKSAFNQCSSLKTFTADEGLTEIGEYAFGLCTSLTSVSLPTSLEYIAPSAGMENAFLGFNSLVYTEKNGMKFLGNREDPYVVLVEAAPEVETAVIPDGVKIISCGAFEKCQMLKSVVLPNTVTQISPKAFNLCRFLTDINLPDSLKSIGDYAFYNTALYLVNFGSGLTSIGAGAFSGTAIAELHIPKNVKYVGESAFYGCRELKTVTVAGAETQLESAFRNCEKLTDFVFPEGTTAVPSFIFSMNGATGGLVSVTIPKTVTEIGEAAFMGCHDLVEIRYGGTVNEWNAINKLSSTFAWDRGTGAYTVYCSDGELKKSAE